MTDGGVPPNSSSTEGGGLDPLGLPDLESLINPDEQRRFRRLCLDTQPDELAQLGETVELHVAQVKANALPATDCEMAELLADRLCQLVADGDSLAPIERALARGAVEYFLLTSDADDDLSDALGFDDDVRVFNSVARRLDRPQLVIQLSDFE